jgi:hypothetical protein
MITFGGPHGSGWNQIKVILTPDELRSVIEDLDIFIIKAGLVHKHYANTSKNELITAYNNYWDKIISGEQCDYIFENKFGRFVITDNINDIEIKDSNEPNSKIIKAIKPIIEIEPFSLQYRDFRLATNEYNPEGNIGINFTYPKIYSFLEYENDQVVFYKTDLFSTCKLFESLSALILKKTNKKFKISNGERDFKPNVFISIAARDKIQANYYIKINGLIIK